MNKKVSFSFLEKEVDPAFRQRAKIILENLFLHKINNLVDVGCGRGYYTNNIGRLYPKIHVRGVDISRQYLNQATADNLSNVEYTMSKAEHLPFAENSFDAVICSELLEHVPNDRQVISEIARVAKRKAVIMISVPNKNYPFLWDPINWMLERTLGTHVNKDIWWMAGIWADHLRLYEESEITNKLKEAGLKVEKVWRIIRWCVPFSHFLLYGIGKNLVERGWCKTADRFNDKAVPSGSIRIVKKVFDFGNQFNEQFGPNKNTAFQGLVIKAVKK